MISSKKGYVLLFFTLVIVFGFSSSLYATQLVYSTYLSGSLDSSQGNSVSFDTAGNIYVTGFTYAPSFRTTNTGYDTTFNGGDRDIFVSKINPNLSGIASLVYSTLLGGSDTDVSRAGAVSKSGNIYLSGYTDSTDFPVTSNAIFTTSPGSQHAFVTEINPSLSGASSLVYSTYIISNDYEDCWGIAVDSAGMIYIGGFTDSFDFPTTPNAYQNSPSGGLDSYVCKINPSLSGTSAFLYSSYMGGDSHDLCYGLAIDTAGNIYITGYTTSSTYPTTLNAFDNINHGNNDVFVSKINPNLSGASSLLYSSFLGSTGDDGGYGVAADLAGNLYVAGYTYSTTFPVTSNAFDTVPPTNSYHAFVSKLNPTLSGTSSLVYSTYLKGNIGEQCQAIAVDAEGNAYVTGFTFSTNFPKTSNAYDSTANGQDDVFVTKINPNLSGVASLVFSTILGGNNFDIGQAIAADTLGNIYVSGYSYSTNYPATSNAIDSTLHGRYNVFVTKLNTILVVPIDDWMLYSTKNDDLINSAILPRKSKY